MPLDNDDIKQLITILQKGLSDSSDNTETAPKPTDNRVSIISVPGERVVAIRFSGFWSDSNYAEHNAELQAFIAAEGLITEGEPVFAYYNAPFVPWFLRRNEVIYRLAGTPE